MNDRGSPSPWSARRIACVPLACLSFVGCSDVGSRVSISMAKDKSRAVAAAGPAGAGAAGSEALEWAAAGAEAGPGPLPGMACRVNEHGFRVKVLPTEPGVRCLDAAPAGVLTGPALKHFQPYFVFDVWPADGAPEYYRVGATPRPVSILGWAPAAALARWDSRVGVRYARRAGQRVPPLFVYAEKAPLVEILETGSTEVPPLARATLEAERTLMPWPVAETDQVTADGRVYELVRINFLAEVREGADLAEEDGAGAADGDELYSVAERQTILGNVRKLDLVFCVDNTNSTGPFLDSIRKAVRDIARELATHQYRPDLNMGLVLYRDYVDGLMFEESGRDSVVKSFALEGDHEAFLGKIEHLREPSVTSDGYEEAGFDGLFAAVTGTAWRGDELSTRVVVLIGDNSFHEPGSERNPGDIGVAAIRREAEARRVKIFTLNIDGAGGREEQHRHLEQFEAIAAACSGACFQIADASLVARQVLEVSGTQLAEVEERARVTSYFADGKSAEQIVAEHELDVRQVTEVMEFLEGAGIDVERLGAGHPTFATGWALLEVRGAEVLEREVYVARNELDILLSALNQLRSVLSGSTRFGHAAGQLSFLAHADPLADYFSGQAAEELDVFLMAKGIPVGRNSVLRLSSTNVEHMSEESRRGLHDRIARWCIPSLTNVLNDDAVWTHRDVHEFGWVAEALLP